MERRASVPWEEERPTLRRTQSQPAPEKPDFEIEIDVERFGGKVVAGLTEAMEEQQTQQAKQAQIKELARRMDNAVSGRSSTCSQAPLTEREVELESAARIARETANAEGRSSSPARSIISISSTETTAIVLLPPAEDTMPDVGTQTDPPRPPPPPQSNNQERQGASWTPINMPIEPRAMREGLVSWDSRALPYIGNGNLTLSDATGPLAANSAAERTALCRRLSAQHAHTERLRARGADLASMAGATAFDHTGRLTVFTSFSPRQNRRKRAREWREWTIHENVDIGFPDKYRWDVTDSEDGDGGVEEGEVEPRVGKSEGYRTIYSYFQPVFRHRQGVPPERVSFETRNGYLHVDGMQVPHLPGFEYGVGYADEETSQRMMRERESTPTQVDRPVRGRSASQFGQFTLQVAADARERLRDPRNRIPGRFYCEEEDCGQSYDLESNLRFHRRNSHRPVETHRCEECPKSFRQEDRLERHGRIHARQRREALVEAVLSHEGAHPQATSESAVSGTARPSAETLRAFEALAGFDELPLRLDGTKDAQPQASEQNGNAEGEHTGTTPTGSDPPASDDDDDNVGLRGGYLEGPRPLYRRISYLVQMLKYTSLPGFVLGRRFNQRYGRWRSILTAISLHNPTPEDEKWKAFWIEWSEGLPRVSGTPSDIVTHAEAAGAIEKYRAIDIADPKLSACPFGLYAARKERYWAVNGYIFDLLSNRDGVSTGHVQKAPVGAYLLDSDDDAENVGLRGGADESPSTLDFAPETPSISYLVQMLKGPYGSDTLRPLHQRKIDELRSLNSVILNHNPTEDDARWKLFWIYWKDNWRETIPRPVYSWVLTTGEVVVATVGWLRKLELEGRELEACLYGLHAAAAPTFLLAMGHIYDLLSNRARINYPFSHGPRQYAPTGAGSTSADGLNENVRLRGGADERVSTSEIIPMNLGSTTTGSDPRETFPPIGQELVYLAAFQVAESFVPDEPHPEDKYPAWKDFWSVYWHSIPGASESGMLRSSEVDATIQELEKRDLVEPDLSACLVGLKLARKRTFWEVQDAIVDAILARKKVSDSKASAAHQHVPINGEASARGVSVKTSSSDQDAENMGLRGGAPEKHKISYLGRLEAAAAIEELKRLGLSEPQLSPYFSGLRASMKLTLLAVRACIGQVLKGRGFSKARVFAPEQDTSTTDEALEGESPTEAPPEASTIPEQHCPSDEAALAVPTECEASGGGAPTEEPPEAFVTSQQCRPSPASTIQMSAEKDSLPQIGKLVILQILDYLTKTRHYIGKYREKLKVCNKEVVAAENTVRGCLLLADMDMLYGAERQTNHIVWTESRKIIDYVERAMPFKKTDGDGKLCGKPWSRARKLKQKSTGAFPLRTGGGSEASILRGGEGNSYPSSGKRRRPSSYASDPQSLAMATSNTPRGTASRTSSVGRTCGSQQESQNYSTANSSMSESTGASCRKERSNSRRAKARENRKGSRKRERGEDPEENDRQYLERQKKRKLQSESEAQDAPQAAHDVASVGSMQERYESTTLLRHPQSRDSASTEAAEKEAPAKIRTIALLKVLKDLCGVSGDLRASGESLDIFITKFGLAANEVGSRLEKAVQKLMYMLLGPTKDAVLPETQEKLGGAVKLGKPETTEEAEACAKILGLARRVRIESEGTTRRRYGGISMDSGLRGGAGVYNLPTGAAFQLRRQDDCIPSLHGVHEPMAINGRPSSSCGPQKGKKTNVNRGQYHIDVVFEKCGIRQRPLAMHPEQGEGLRQIPAMALLCEHAPEELLKKTYERWSGSQRSFTCHEAIHKLPAAYQELDLAGMEEARQAHGKVPQLRGGDFKDLEAMQQLQKTASEAMQQSQKTAEHYTADGSNGMMGENNTCQYDHGSNFCSSHQMHHNSNRSTFKWNMLHQPTVSSRHNGHVAQPLSSSPHAHQTYAIPPARALLFGQPTSQPPNPSMAWQSNKFPATNGAVGLIGKTDMCYYPDPVNSQFCTTHHIIHGRLGRPPPSSYIAPYALDETTVMAQARALKLGSPYALDETAVMAQSRAITLGSPYALDETTLMAQARALTLGFVNNGVPDVAMLQHQARVHASQSFGQNPQWTHEMQPSARSHLWASQGGIYFGRGLQQIPASSNIASCSQNVAQKVESKWGDTILVAGREAGNWELQCSQPKNPAAMPSNTRKRQGTSDVEEDEVRGANALVPNQNVRKRTKTVPFAGLGQNQQPSTFVNQHVDWEMVDAPLAFNQILENEGRLMEGRTDGQDWTTGVTFGEASGTLRGGCLDDDAHDPHTHGTSTLPMRNAQQSTRQFTSCVGQTESGTSRIPGPVSPPIAFEQLPLSVQHVATTGLDGTNDENQNPFNGGETSETGEVTRLDTSGFNPGFEVPPFDPEYPSASRDAVWRAAALRRMNEVLATQRGPELVRSYRDGQLPSVLGRRQRSTSSPISPLSRPAPTIRDDSFTSVASAHVPSQALNPTARTFVPFHQYSTNPLRQPFNPPDHALLDHPFIQSANGAVQFQIPFHSTNPLRPPLQPRELSSPHVYPVFTQRASTPEARRRLAQELHDAASFSDIEIAVEDARRTRERLRRRQEAQRAVTPPPRQRIAWDAESEDRGSLSDLENPEEFARRSRRFRRRREALRRDRALQGAELPIYSNLSRLPRPEMSGGLALIEDDMWERNQRLAREAESAPLYLRSFVDALPTGTVGGVHGDRLAYIDSLMRSTAASGHRAGERGGVPEGVWYNISFERRLDSKPAPRRRWLNIRSNNHRHVVESENDFSGAESDEDEEYVVFSWDIQIPAGGMKDLLRSTGTEWGVKAVRARDWALDEMAMDPKGDECCEALGEWWEAVRGGASRDERCRCVGIRVLEP